MRALGTVLLAGCSFHGLDLATADGPPGEPADAVPSDWWDPAWSARMQLSVHDGAALDLRAGYQVGFVFDVDAAPCTGDRNDVRIVRGASEQDRVIDETAGTEWIWFALATPITAGDTSLDYWMYCGNPTPPPAPADPAAVFVFHDDFARTTLGPAWQAQSDVQLDGAVVRLGGNDSGIITVETYGPGHAVDFVVSVTVASSAVFWAGFQNGFPDVPPWIHWWSMQPGEVRPDYWAENAGAQWYGINEPLDTEPHLYGVENYGDASAYRYHDVIVDEHVYDLPPSPPVLNARLHNNTFSSSAHYDWMRVRYAVRPPPDVTVGPAESR